MLDTELNEKRLIVVLGMHRSGTSAIARGLLALGVNLGNNLMPGRVDDNEKGFWEDLDIYALNEELLECLGSDWQMLRRIDWKTIDNEALNVFKLRAVELLSNKMKDISILGMKDPRIAILLPFWKDVFSHLDVSPSCVIVSRHPLSVADSLRTRNGLGLEKSCYLWLVHMVSSILSNCGRSTIVVSYDMLMDQPGEQLLRMLRLLNLSVSADYSEAMEEFKVNFLDERLRHTRYYLSDLYRHPEIPKEVIMAYEALEQLARDEISIAALEIQDKFCQLERILDNMEPAFRYITDLEKGVAGYAKTVSELNMQITALKQIATERDSNISNAETDSMNNGRKIIGHKGITIAEQASLYTAKKASPSLVKIIIPTYKNTLSKYDRLSLEQCCKILGKYSFSAVCPNDLDISEYKCLFDKYCINYDVQFFPKDYFESLESYNKLLLNKLFYERFIDSEFILVHQLDAFVFRDELEYWCWQDYDYIGAPWFEGFNYSTANSKLLDIAGNGGFSLRRIPGFLRLLSLPRAREYSFDRIQEDSYYANMGPEIDSEFRVAPPDVAMHFSFECQPDILFQKTGGNLPFGCHAWWKYRPDFWQQFITGESRDICFEFSAMQKEFESAKGKLAVVEAKFEEAHSMLESSLSDIHKLETRIKESEVRLADKMNIIPESESDRIKAASNWRITSPLRYLIRLLMRVSKST
jgi:hypothetical protein